MGNFENNFAEIAGLVQDPRDPDKFYTYVEKLIADGAEPKDILEHGLMPGMRNSISKFPFMLFTAHNFYKVFPLIKPSLFPNGESSIGKAAICTVKGDMHRPGKNLVKLMIEAKGIEVIDLGTNCEPLTIIKAVKDSSVRVLCLSSLPPTTLPMLGKTIEALKAAGLRDTVKVMVGGALVTQDFAREIGADGYTPEAVSAAEVCRGYFVK